MRGGKPRRSDYLDAIKFIPLSINGDWHLTLGDVATLLPAPIFLALAFLCGAG